CVTCGEAGAAVAVLFFFFQAEDGIRDWSVTGVQTCALPICGGGRGGGMGPGGGGMGPGGPPPDMGSGGPGGAGGGMPGGTQKLEIGRASCRERGESSGGGGWVKKKKEGRERWVGAGEGERCR